MGMEQAKIQDVVAGMTPMLEAEDCIKGSISQNYQDQLLVLKASALAPWAMEAENQLWIGKNGNGLRPDAKGRGVFGRCLHDGEGARFDRADFYGIADPSRLPDWAIEKLSELDEQNSDELEEYEF